MNGTVGLIVIAVLLVPLAGVFAAADAALNSVSRAQIDTLVRSGRPGARALAKVVADRPRHVNLLLLLRLAAETCATVLLTVALMTLIQPVWAGALTAWGIMLVVSYVLIGVGPRTLGRQHPYRVGMLLAAPIRALATLLGPLTKLLIVIGNAITPGHGFRQGPFSSEVELRELVDMASTSGVVDEGERQMIHSVFELGDTLVREVMVPRPDVVWTERDTPVDKVLRLALKSGHSRIPVLGEDIDDIVGVAYLKDLVRAREYAADGRVATLSVVMRPAVFVPDSKRVDELLKEMQAARNHMAIVIDEYGGTAGVVTIEDVLEEIVGEITDEYDIAEVPEVQVLDGGRLRLSARLPATDLLELFPGDEGLDDDLVDVLAAADVDTVGGLLAQQLGKVPLPGARAEVAGLAMLAEGGNDARGRVRIITVLVEPMDPEARERVYRGDRNGVEADQSHGYDPGDHDTGSHETGSHETGSHDDESAGEPGDGAARWEESDARYR
jgi:CBS domain containing-hemolysin-like protein